MNIIDWDKTALIRNKMHETTLLLNPKLNNNILIHILIVFRQASHITYLEFSDKCNDKH